MKSINEIFNTSITVKKSEFIATIFPVDSVSTAQDYLNQTRKKYYDATHNCYAYVIGEKKEIMKCSDDKEPSQTAGVVILDAILKNELTNVLLIVTRYFGGIKLGANGLVRSYSQASSEVIKISKLLELKYYSDVCFNLNYNDFNIVSKYLNNYKITNKIFLENVSVTYSIDCDDIDNIIKKVKELTKDNVDIIVLPKTIKYVNNHL